MRNNKYPKINYIGNKQKIADWIVDNFPIKSGIVLDLFCGGCSISYKLKELGFTVISNDILYSNFVIAKSLIENNKYLFKKNINIESFSKQNILKKYKNLEHLNKKLFFKSEVKELSKICLFSETLKGYEKYLFLSLIRRAIIRKIPYSRMNIKWTEIIKLRNEEYSYSKYKRKRAYHNDSFINHIINNIDDYNNAVFDNNKKNKAYQMDAFKLLKKIKEKVDLIYMDPPYPSTMNNYNSFYGEFDNIFNKRKTLYSNLVSNNNFLNIFSKIIIASIGKTDYIAISMNDKCKPSALELIDTISDYIECYNIFSKEKTYQVTSKTNKNKSNEILIVLKMKLIVKENQDD